MNRVGDKDLGVSCECVHAYTFFLPHMWYLICRPPTEYWKCNKTVNIRQSFIPTVKKLIV